MGSNFHFRARDRPSGFEASAELGRSTVGAAVAFSRIALGFSTETDSPLQEAGFETSVPPDRCSGGTYPADVRFDAPTFLSSGAC